MNGKKVNELVAGETATFSKTVSESDVYLYAGITGDLNPAHIDETYAAQTFFKGRIAHGMLLAGFVSNVVGMRLPGPGTVYIDQSLKFLAPARIGDTITAHVQVLEIDAGRNRVQLRTWCSNQEGTVVMEGLAKVSPPK